MSKSSALPSLSSRILNAAKSIEHKRIAFLTSKNLLPGYDELILALKFSNGITMGALAESTGISASSATKITTKLEAAGFVRREASRVDSRQNHAFLTDTGKTLANEIIIEYDAIDAKLTSKAKPKEIERGFKLFDRLESDPSSAAKTPKKAGGKKNKSKTLDDAGSKSKKKKKSKD